MSDEVDQAISWMREYGRQQRTELTAFIDRLRAERAALLAVAKAAEWQEDPKSREQYQTKWYCSVCQRIKEFGHMEECLYSRLDLTDPDWRTWTP